MDANEPAAPQPSLTGQLSGFAANALRYWEPRRLIYNGVLASVVIVHFLLAWPSSRAMLSFDLLLGFFFLAVLANVVYCAAYVVDLFVQCSGLEASWRRGRVLLFAIGTAFAATITHLFAKGLFGA